jgi:hypothetical protein
VISTIKDENAAYPDIEARTPVVHDSDVATETPSCCRCQKTFYGRNLLMFVHKVFVPGKPFQLSLIFLGKGRSLP